MNRIRTALLALMLACSAPSFAGDDSLYRALGEKPGIEKLMMDFSARLKKDPRIGSFFKDTNPKALAEQLRDQVCELSGGPCKYEGAKMKPAHADLGVKRGDFNALVEVLQQSMDDAGIPFATQNKLLALLAPMHRDIVTR
ncbi:group 1 truncated hemoglobin [Pelomonas sp. SE-A7]|uniref:group I truncated hemoglobin n=1 Tax=Pelomonas sp. SE-A7 TaxID=3054953 RepID=UPI00259CA473|nr:group 1 truncated hemoglobin [Pelomonas sp. SE-A7]MDM4766856.1 group 1 truncated hemoglobin [Pelomonas sp. SE-A7]